MIFKMFAIFCNIKSITFFLKKGKAGGFTNIQHKNLVTAFLAPQLRELFENKS